MDDNVVEIEDTSPTRVLPREILSQIFTFLPLEDRKCVRLTCRSWYDCCTSMKITKHEKFVFRTDPCVEHIDAVVLRSNYSLVNLEFQGLSVGILTANVWKTYGPRIRELEFHRCQWDVETISNIILHCENLASLVITEDEVDEPIRIAYSPRLLNDFIKKEIRRPKLLTLSISIKHEEHESVLRNIFLLHPSIKHFAFKLISDGSEFLDPFAIRLDRCLNPDAGLESLTSMIRTPQGQTGALVNKDRQGFRLKYLETWLIFAGINSPTQEDEIFNFFRSQKNLEVVKLRTSIASDDFIYIILESCPKLREFRFESTSYTWYMGIRPSEISRFITCISKLECLELSFGSMDSEQVSAFFNLLPDTVQLNLTSLNWGYPGGSSKFCAAFLQHCSYLKHLRLAKCYDTTLQTIFQHLLELQTLVLGNDDKCTAFGFSGRTVDGNEVGYSIKRLQQLKHLELSDYEFDLLKKNMLELHLPRLQVLSLIVGYYQQLSEETLNHFASHLPELKVLAIDCFDEDDDYIEDTIQLCKPFSKLHRLIFTEYSFHTVFADLEKEKQMVESIFSACPSLGYISDYIGNTYIRELFTGKILYKDRLRFPSGNIFK